MSEKIHAQIAKLEEGTAKLHAKIAANGERMKALVGKLAGVKPGDVVTWKGERYRVTGILSDALPAKGLPVLSGLKMLKNGKTVKSETMIKGAWKPEQSAKVAIKKPAKKVSKVARMPRISRKAALAAVQAEGTA